MRPVSSAHRVASIATFLLLACGLAWASQAGSAPRPVLLFVDDLHLQFRDTPRTRLVLQRLLSAALRNGTTVALVTTGSSSVSVAPTSDPETLNAAVRRITGNALRPPEVLDERRQPQMLAERRRRAGVAGRRP